ncbi:unnamed protein product [Rotaria sp. Silwood2]|nr:unnamed protein product [Rotaria sp. Silwood2]CAF2705482.1 unnamed protein product [Rotaria sp. Silwood2]CAF2966470.1 unnamed protein product [Rotaria sp. Silwood2]CAF3099949.1 unnamed protein product [Rotaria sp. Silwood2]CAF4209833.1 unnamed protein product [Rotaria sp. Silwood2]
MGELWALVAENTSTNRMLNVDVTVTESLDVRNSRNSFIILDSIPPNHRQLLFLMEMTSERSQVAEKIHRPRPYSCTYKLSSIERRPPEPIIHRADDIHAIRPIT